MPSKLTIELDPELRRRATEAAAAQGRSLSEVVRSMLEALVEETSAASSPSMMEVDPIFQMAGRFSGSSENVSERVKEILRDDIEPKTGLGTKHDNAD